MSWRVVEVAFLLFGSGTCALIYQIAWLREMRLIFGASTAASAAVLAIFMGGLGLGGVILGRRADRSARPLGFYANLELAIASSSALTPVLMWLARGAYIGLGGSVVLGLGAATAVRLALATLVLCVPTFLMGGTLPAASKAVETDQDLARRHAALLYGSNTLGAVTGAFLATFFMLEVFGTRNALWLACLLNALVAIYARSTARTFPVAPAPAVPTAAPAAAPSRQRQGGSAPATFVLAAAAIVGFGFFLMELVWYRMLAPLLGGSSFTFGLILATALLGIGLGGAAYALFGGTRRATLSAFALSCVIEAAFIAVPYALGDWIAFLAILLRPLGTLGFYGMVLGWTLVTALVVLPAAFVSGVQFPLLVALLGAGGEKVGRHVGLAYAWNTVGAILGSLAGGFGLLPLLSATGTWRAVVILLVALGVAALALSARSARWWLLLPATVALIAVWLLTATGPTAAWRHSPIGAGRAEIPVATRNALHAWANSRRQFIRWAVDGVESSVALEGGNSYAFLVSGKSDGNARNDAPTQVMSGLVGAILHPHPVRALVVGLGTGSTAGWLAAVPSIERVDVVELEPAILEVAKACTPVNRNVMSNPKVHIDIGDAREVLLTTPQRYDIIFSEPSNPYRAGIASLFTREYYEAATAKLNPGGLFVQWVQAYEVDSETIWTTYATLASVFPFVESWQTQESDLLLVASLQPSVYDVGALRARVEQEPFKSALNLAWRSTGLEGFLAGYVASPALARAVAERHGAFLNTDDHTIVEFAFARSVGRPNLFDLRQVREAARLRGDHRPAVRGGEVDWSGVEDQLIARQSARGVVPALESHLTPDQRQRVTAQRYILDGNARAAVAAWKAQPREPVGSAELAMLAEALAHLADEKAIKYIESLRRTAPAEADAVLARLRWRQGRVEEATGALATAFERYRDDPWPLPGLMSRALALAEEIGAADRTAAVRLHQALGEHFSVFALEEERLNAILKLLPHVSFERSCVEAIAPLEPYVPWQRDFLAGRMRCYRLTGDPRFTQARQELDEFLRHEPAPFAYGLDQSHAAAMP